MARALAEPKTIYLEPDVEEELQNRLSRIEGHVRWIKRMLMETFRQAAASSRLHLRSD